MVEIKQATLVKGDEKRVVGVETPEAKLAFSEGFTLPEAQTPVNNAVEPVSGDIKPIEPEVINKTGLQENIQSTFDKYGGSAGANEQFVQGVAKFATGKALEDRGLIGKSISDVIQHYNIGGSLKGFGMTEPPKTDMLTTEDTTTPVKPDLKTLTAQYTEQGEAQRAADMEAEGVAIKETAANKAKQTLDDMNNTMDFDNIIKLSGSNARSDDYDAEVLAREGQAIPMGEINKQINALSKDFNLKESQIRREEMLKNATDIYAYNTQLNQYNMLRGEATDAANRVSEMAADRKEYRAMAVDDLERQNLIDTQEAEDLRHKNDRLNSYDDKQYVAIEPENYEAMVREYGENRIYTDAYGDSYLKPEKEVVLSDLEIYEEKKKIDAKYAEQGGTIVDIDGVDYVKNADGSYSRPVLPTGPSDVPKDILDKSKTVYDNVLALQETEWGSIVGGLQGELNSSKLLNADQEAALAQFDKLNASLTLENMGIMKGVLSDADIKIIKNASTSLRRTTDEETFNKELLKIKRAAKSVEMSQFLNPGQLVENDDGSYSYMNMDGTMQTGALNDGYVDTTLPKLDYNIDEVGSENLSKIDNVKIGSKAGQCGRFVNNKTNLGVGDTYESKMAKMDPNIDYPEPGMVFTMPYKNTGHTGFIVGIEGDKAIVKDSNWSGDEKVKIHEIPINVITGLTYA